MQYFSGVTVLITHYNRSHSLERLLLSFADLRCEFEDIIVSDDGSSPEHIDYLRELQLSIPFKLILSDKNRGLGNNINKGQDAVNTHYTLYIQEDFIPTRKFPDRLADAIKFMKEDEGLDIVRFYAYVSYPYLEHFKNGFYKMHIKPWYLNYKKIYYYSDHPHLRRSNFLNKFGRYVEGKRGDRTEYRMCLNFIQKKGRGLFYGNFKDLFIQCNPDSEPSTMKRKAWTTSKNPFISNIRFVYRQLRYNFDILFSK